MLCLCLCLCLQRPPAPIRAAAAATTASCLRGCWPAPWGAMLRVDVALRRRRVRRDGGRVTAARAELQPLCCQTLGGARGNAAAERGAVVEGWQWQWQWRRLRRLRLRTGVVLYAQLSPCRELSYRGASAALTHQCTLNFPSTRPCSCGAIHVQHQNDDSVQLHANTAPQCSNLVHKLCFGPTSPDNSRCTTQSPLLSAKGIQSVVLQKKRQIALFQHHNTTNHYTTILLIAYLKEVV